MNFWSKYTPSLSACILVLNTRSGGGGDTQILFGQGCAARASNPYSFLRVIMDKKGIHFGGFFSKYRSILANTQQFLKILEKCAFHVRGYLLLNGTPCLGIYFEKLTIIVAHPCMSYYLSTPWTQHYRIYYSIIKPTFFSAFSFSCCNFLLFSIQAWASSSSSSSPSVFTFLFWNPTKNDNTLKVLCVHVYVFFLNF